MTSAERIFMVEYCVSSAKYFREEQKKWWSMTDSDLISWVRYYDYLWDNR